MAPSEEACGDWEELTESGFHYLNKVWNKRAITDYEQCVMRRVIPSSSATVTGADADGKVEYGWRWQWPEREGHFGLVNAYPEAVYGHGPLGNEVISGTGELWLKTLKVQVR